MNPLITEPKHEYISSITLLKDVVLATGSELVFISSVTTSSAMLAGC